MSFQVACECGHVFFVVEGDAGSSQLCPCGKTVQIPSLSKLRSVAGYEPTSEFRTVEPLENIPEGATLYECLDCGRYSLETRVYTVLYLGFFCFL